MDHLKSLAEDPQEEQQEEEEKQVVRGNNTLH
jgi:hypothetical protein